jgi:predicted nucleotidyltransferase
MSDKLCLVEYVRPVEAVIPGVQGRILGVLARTGTELTMRTAAGLAGVSVAQAAVVLNHLVALGLVERREAGRASLVALVRDNEAARAVLTLASLTDAVLARLRIEARDIEPMPTSLTVFGSFAAGAARADSDLDVLAVRPEGVAPDERLWLDSLGRWRDRATRIAGNPVKLMEVSTEEAPRLLSRPGSVWEAIGREGVLLAGTHLREVGKAA